MERISIVDLGQIGEPAAGVVNHFIDKISGALEWMVSPKNMKPAILEANKSIIEEIANRQDINPIERAAIVSNYRKIVKEYKNQVDIMRLAVEHLTPNAEPEKVSDDWVTFFFEKSKNVNDEYMKIPNSCFYNPPILLAFMYRTNSEDIKNIKRYDKMKIFIYDLRELDSLGLIQYRFSDFHTLVIRNKVFYYGNKRIRFETNKRTIALGNVALTSVGKQLCRIVPMEYDDRILEICLDVWNKLGYHPIVECCDDNDC